MFECTLAFPKCSACTDWIEKVIDDSPPPYGYQHNVLEGLGITLIYPLRFCYSLFRRVSEEEHALVRIAENIHYLVFSLIFALPFACLGSALRITGAMLPHAYDEVDDSIIERTAPEKIEQLYDLAINFKELCEEMGIDYFLVSGTFLGAVRHKGIIPWDDDIDFVILKKDEAKFLSMHKKLKERGLCIENDRGNYGLYFSDEMRTRKYHPDEKHKGQLDLFIWEEKPGGKITYSSLYWRAKFPKEYFLKEEMEEIREWTFGPPEKQLSLKGPKYPEGYLKRYYGDDYLEFGVETHKHIQVFSMRITIPVIRKQKFRIVNHG